MRELERLKKLRNLYQLQSIGYRYFHDLPQNSASDPEITVLPDDLQKLEKEVQNCHLCGLSKTRTHVVFGEGNPRAEIMFVGEGPGQMEDETGRPFVGRAGQLLTKIIETTLELKREEVYIANIVKCRPPKNRVPTPEEANTCLPYLHKQIELVDPRIIIALGATSYRYLTGDLNGAISKIRGEFIEFGGRKLLATFHPSYLLRNPSAKKLVYFDMLKIKALL
ncbi:MAG: uracil-DNA glycosylase [Campylobacteraceae bacterium 4484_4]|nr:MAG: uracil-DNA glycosylase [Campylobacteraceae bacterium 4484_4]